MHVLCGSGMYDNSKFESCTARGANNECAVHGCAIPFVSKPLEGRPWYPCPHGRLPSHDNTHLMCGLPRGSMATRVDRLQSTEKVSELGRSKEFVVSRH